MGRGEEDNGLGGDTWGGGVSLEGGVGRFGGGGGCYD